MRRLPYIFLGYVALGLQIGLKDALSIHNGPPNFVLLAVVFMCLSMPRNPALMGSFLLGLAQDCLGQHPAGLYALSYGLTALLIRGTHQVIYGHHPLAHAALTLLGGIITAIVLGVYSLVHPAAARSVENNVVVPAMRESPWPLLISAVYTAFSAPGVLWLLNRAGHRPGRGSGRRAWG
jgi:rod shape-determining protein MreD